MATDDSSEMTTAAMAQRVLAKLVELADARGADSYDAAVRLTPGGQGVDEVAVDGLSGHIVTVMLPHRESVGAFEDLVQDLYNALCVTRGRAWR